MVAEKIVAEKNPPTSLTCIHYSSGLVLGLLAKVDFLVGANLGCFENPANDMTLRRHDVYYHNNYDTDARLKFLKILTEERRCGGALGCNRLWYVL